MWFVDCSYISSQFNLIVVIEVRLQHAVGLSFNTSTQHCGHCLANGIHSGVRERLFAHTLQECILIVTLAFCTRRYWPEMCLWGAYTRKVNWTEYRYGRKLLRIDGKQDFHGENFCGLLDSSTKTPHPQIAWYSQKFSPSKVSHYLLPNCA